MADEHLDDAVDRISLAATPDAGMAGAHRYADPLLDAFSIASASIHSEVRPPDPAVERHLAPADAIAAASGLMTSPVLTEGRRWWTTLSGPAVAQGESVEAILPRGGGALAISGGTRQRHRFGGATGDSVMGLTGSFPPDASWIRLVSWSIRRRRSQVWLLLAASLLSALLGLLLPIVTGALFSYAVPAGEGGLAVRVLIAFALASVGGALLLLARNVVIIRLRDASDARLSPGIMAHLLRLPAPFFRKMPAGEILDRSLSVETARDLVDDGSISLVLTSAFGIVNIFFLLAVDVVLGVAMSIVVAALVGVVMLAQRRARPPLRRMLDQRARSDAEFMALVDAIVPIRVSGAESRALSRWSRLQSRAITTFRARMAAVDLSRPVLVAAPVVADAVLVTAVVMSGPGFTSALFMAAFVAVVQLTVAMTMFAQNLWMLGEIGPTLSRMTPITTTEVERPGPRRAPGVLDGTIQLSDVVFGYDTERPPLLDGLDLTVESGEFVAVVGPSGSGKSTVLRLILGFETPWSGVVSYDGQDLAELDVYAVRRQMGTVLQASVPFGATYRECICGPLHIDDDRLWEVIAEAGLLDEVRARGLDAPVGDRGGAISGGQRQRLMIARALASDPRVILLDEATSALDNVTQDIVMRSILGRPVTRIAIAHRLTTVERADRILVVSDGSIVEEGTPAELLASGGHFARLAARQEF